MDSHLQIHVRRSEEFAFVVQKGRVQVSVWVVVVDVADRLRRQQSVLITRGTIITVSL